jgi:hypothetical protein
MKNVHVFTVAANNYLPKVRVLMSSLRKHHPEWRLHLVIADAAPPAEAVLGLQVDEIHEIEKLGVPNFRRWAFCHLLIELATAIKPFVMAKLLARPHCDAVIYLDPDTAVFAPLSEVTDALEKNDIVLTPHITIPEQTVDGIVANEIPTLQHGIYNLGFIAVAAGEQGRAFARWWTERTYRYCREDVPHGIYTDQRWVDFVPAFFDKVKVLRSPGHNCAPWNLSNRSVKGHAPAGLTVNGSPLVFFHFSHLGKVPDERSHGGQAAMKSLLAWYRAESLPSAIEAALPPYAFSAFDDGSLITLEQRMVYRARTDLQRAYPDPFVARTGGGYLAWWRAYAKPEYPRLFDRSTRDAELLHLSACLSYSHEETEIVGDDEITPDVPNSRLLGKVATYLRRLRVVR